MEKTVILKFEITNLQEYEELLAQAEDIFKRLKEFRLELKSQALSPSTEKGDKAQPQKQ